MEEKEFQLPLPPPPSVARRLFRYTGPASEASKAERLTFNDNTSAKNQQQQNTVQELLSNRYTNETLREYLQQIVYLGQGAFGNTFSGAVPCSDRMKDSFRSRDYVGKLFADKGAAQKEYAIQKIIRRIDPLRIYTVQAIKFCDAYLPSNTSEILFNKVKSAGHTPKSRYVSQIVYPYGGVPLHKLVSVVDNMFFPAFFLFAMTGYMNEIQKVYHTDIKEDNIMYNIVSQKFVLIDFGRVASDLRDITNTFVYSAFLKMLKKNDDPMFIFYTQLSPEVMYFCNMVRYVSWNLSQKREISLLDFNEIFTKELSKRIKYIYLKKVIDSCSDNYGSKLFPLYESFIHRVISTFKIHGSELDRLKSDLTERVLGIVNHLLARQDIWGLSYTMYRFFKSKYSNDRGSRSLELTNFLDKNVLSVPDAQRPNLIQLHQMLCVTFSSFDESFIPQYSVFSQKIYETLSKSQNIVNNERNIIKEKTYVENLIKSLSLDTTEPS